ncbi:MAG: conjugal transfer protein TraF [Gammaproteobacteria bacterium]|nr:conjugal transfer protein TraF [Gammaproteobacteria bacterium]
MIRYIPTLTISILFAGLTHNALADDARSLGLGGSAIAHGAGVHGAYENPASLMFQQRSGYTTHVHFGGLADVRDNSALIEAITDDTDLADDIEAEIEDLSGQAVQCLQTLNDPNSVCYSGTGNLGALANDVVEILDLADGNSVSGGGSLDFGLALTQTPIPFAVHLRTSVVASGTPAIASGDRDYINQFAESLADGDLTVGEIQNNDAFSIGDDGSLQVVQPEDILESEIQGVALLRTQVGVSLAHTFEVGGRSIDFGITPKISALRAANINASISENFDDQSDSLSDQFSDSEESSTSITVDIGMALPLDSSPLAIGVVLRNAIPENIKTANGFKVETTPQLVVGTAYPLGPVVFTADAALNSAKVDNLETQRLAIGAEFSLNFLRLRAGLSHDAKRDEDASAMSIGMGLGPLQIGARLAGDSITSFTSQIGAQLSYSF